MPPNYPGARGALEDCLRFHKELIVCIDILESGVIVTTGVAITEEQEEEFIDLVDISLTGYDDALDIVTDNLEFD